MLERAVELVAGATVLVGLAWWFAGFHRHTCRTCNTRWRHFGASYEHVTDARVHTCKCGRRAFLSD